MICRTCSRACLGHCLWLIGAGGDGIDLRRQSIPASMMTPQMRSQRLIGNSNPRYEWEQYWKTDDELQKMKKPIREYYERTNYLIQHYMYIDRLLDSSLPHNLIQEYDSPEAGYAHAQLGVPGTIMEEASGMNSPHGSETPTSAEANGGTSKVKRTPKDLYRIKDYETTPLLSDSGKKSDEEQAAPPLLEPDDDAGSQSRIVSYCHLRQLGCQCCVARYENCCRCTFLLRLRPRVFGRRGSRLSKHCYHLDDNSPHQSQRSIRLPHRSKASRTHRRPRLLGSNDHLLRPSSTRRFQQTHRPRSQTRSALEPRHRDHGSHCDHQILLLALVSPYQKQLRPSAGSRRDDRRRLQHLLHHLPSRRLLRELLVARSARRYPTIMLCDLQLGADIFNTY